MSDRTVTLPYEEYQRLLEIAKRLKPTLEIIHIHKTNLGDFMQNKTDVEIGDVHDSDGVLKDYVEGILNDYKKNEKIQQALIQMTVNTIDKKVREVTKVRSLSFSKRLEFLLTGKY